MRITGLRSILFASVSAAALTLGALGAEAQTPFRGATAFPAKDTWTLYGEGLLYQQTDGGYTFAPPIGNLGDLSGVGGGFGLIYRPALSPWSFGVSGKWGKTGTKRKSGKATHTSTNVHTHNITTYSTTTTVDTSTFTAKGVTYHDDEVVTHFNTNFNTAPATTTVRHVHQQFNASRQAEHTILDFTIGRDVGLGYLPSGDAMLTLEAGIRYARLIDNGEFSSISSVSTTGAFIGTSTTRRMFVGKRRFQGLGPRIGFSAELPLTGNFTIDATGGFFALIGQTTEDRSFFTNGTLTGHSNKTVPRTATGYDASLALSYWVTPQAKVSVGYSVDSFSNVFPSGSFGGNPSFTQDKNMMIQGPFARATVKF